MVVQTKFEINQRVKLKPFFKKEGRIIGFYCSDSPIRYYVAYPVKFEIKEAYFFEDELTL